MPDLDEFLKRLASSEPVPGGGSVAALQVAMGCGLLIMVCELTLGREKFAAASEEVHGIRAEIMSILSEARRLVDADAEAYNAVSSAMRLPRESEAEKGIRRKSVEGALKAAVDPPLRTMRAASMAMRLALTLAELGNPSAISDVGSGALSLEAGCLAAKLNVDINLASIRDEEFVGQISGLMPDSARLSQVRTEVLRIVDRVIAR